MVIYTTALIFLRNARFGALFRFAVTMHNTMCSELLVSINKCVQTVRTVFEYIVCISADNNTRSFFSKLQDYTTLNIPKKVSC